MGQKRTTITDHVTALQEETFILLRNYLAWKRISKFEDIREITRIEFSDRMVALKCIENDLVIRISKLDDTDKRVHSFQRALLELPRSNQNKAILITKIFDYHTLIKKVKQDRRNEVLAHLKVGAQDNFEPQYNLLPAIKLIVEITDLMAGVKVGYLWTDGRYEKYNLRQEVLGDIP